MGYIKEFQKEITSRDFSKFMLLWEEYCTSDMAPASEMIELLELIKNSDYSRKIGSVAETLIPLIQTLKTDEEVYSVLRPLVDLQTTNSQSLADLVLSYAEKRHSSHPKYNDLLRISGLRNKENFQGALSAIDLLAHLAPKKFVFHSGGWGVGQVMEFSFLREMIVVEFENSPGRKSVSFANAMRNMTPLEDTHFLSLRFGDPDQLEAQAKKDPVGTIKKLLQDLGPQTASEIKDAMSILVIPEEEWTKWWQQTRSRLKKDLAVDCPDSLKEPFHLRDESLTHEEEFLTQVAKKRSVEDILAVCHSFSKEHPQELKKEAVKTPFLKTLVDVEERKDITTPEITPAERLQVAFIRQTLYPEIFKNVAHEFLEKTENLSEIIRDIEILQYKKQALVWVRGHRAQWPELFLSALSDNSASLIRDYLVKELSSERDLFSQFTQDLIHHPLKFPELYFWFFQRAAIHGKQDLPNFEDKEKIWEAFLILLSRIEHLPNMADLAKKMSLVILADRYKEIRNLFENASLDFMKEFLLLASKCQILGDRDQKSLKALAAVRFPELAGSSSKSDEETVEVIWTTQEGYRKAQERIRHIGTVETIDNAKEIEAARALGDLRENSEYKFAKERRARLQGEMKDLSEKIGRARIVTAQDVSQDEVGVGSIVEVEDAKGDIALYTLLGPWDADAESRVLSLNSKLAQAMLGTHLGDTFLFKDEKFKIKSLKTIFSK